jgi:CRISPR type IV-associated protein Csf1
MITASYLFAPEKHQPGNQRCFYCGMLCGEHHTKDEYVKDTFTNRDIVKFPGSDFVCGCCVESMATLVTTTLIDGDVKSGRGGAPRTYSWVLDGRNNKAFSKAHMDFARNILSNPPEPPFSIILSDSGKKQLIFRAPVNYDRYRYVIQFEEVHVEIDLSRWDYILKCATMASAAIGKKALLSPNEFSCFLSSVTFYGTENPIEEWIEIYSEPMAKVAAWVCKGKEDARNEDFVSARIQTKDRGSDRLPDTKTESGKNGRAKK